MSKPIKHNYVVVIGRIPEEDEDSVYFFNNLTEAQARKAFEKSIYADQYDDEKTPSKVRKDWGVSCYINLILAADTEIKGIHYGYGG
jgi:hypothetical protein